MRAPRGGGMSSLFSTLTHPPEESVWIFCFITSLITHTHATSINSVLALGCTFTRILQMAAEVKGIWGSQRLF